MLQLEQLCDVEYRKFDFYKYPDHVHILQIYAFKALIINVRSTPALFSIC